MEAYSVTAGGDTTGTYTDTAVEADGIYGDSTTTVDIDSAGDIAVVATGGTSSGSATVDASAEAYGINSGDGDVDNSGAITVSATGGTATSSSGAAYADTDEIYGIYGPDGVANSGAITVTATGGTATGSSTADAEAEDTYGIYGYYDVDNTGAVTVTAASGTATSSSSGAYAETEDIYGIYSYYDTANSGAITGAATGGTATSDTGAATAYADAYGIYSTDGDVTSSGDITVTATGGSATSNSGTVDGHADAVGIYLNSTSDVVNSGDIIATASAQAGFGSTAAGIRFSNGGTLTNTGAIIAGADGAAQVAVDAGTLTLVDTYNMNLAGTPTNGAIYVADGAALNINNSALTDMGDDMVLDTEYRIFRTVGTGAVNGAFSSLGEAANPNVTTTYHSQSTAGAVDDTVSVSYTPTGSTFLGGVDSLRRGLSLASGYVNQHLVTGFMGSLTADAGEPRLYADAGNIVSDAGMFAASDRTENGFFMTPYYTTLKSDTEPVGYESDTMGIMGGYDRWLGNALYGLHIGYSESTVEFSGPGFDADEEDQSVFAIGLHGMGSFLEDWTWRSELTFFSGSHEYTGLTGLNLELATGADYDSTGLGLGLMAGRLFEFGEGHLLLPEVGVEYLSVTRDGFTTTAELAAWNVTTDEVKDNTTTGVMSLRWLKRTSLWNIDMVPSVSAGLRYLLTDEAINENQTAGSAVTLLQTERDDVTGTASASLLVEKGKFSTEIAYNGEFGGDADQHSVSLRLNYGF